MARRSKVIVVASVFLLSLCWAKLWAQDERELISNYGFIGLRDGKRVLLRYSTIDDVMLGLGSPTGKEHFVKGGEDFYWTDFWIYSYKSGSLRFYFESKSKRIIRIIANIPMVEGFVFPLGLNSAPEMAAVLDRLRQNPGVVNASRTTRGDISYGLSDVQEFSGWVFSLSPRERWYDVYYAAPWKESEK